MIGAERPANPEEETAGLAEQRGIFLGYIGQALSVSPSVFIRNEAQSI